MNAMSAPPEPLITRRRAPRQIDMTEAASGKPPEQQHDITGGVAYVAVRRVAYDQTQRDTLDEVRVPVFHNTPARVRVGGSVTQNLGDYNSARVEVSIDMPCLPEQTEVQRVYELLSGTVDSMIRRELSIATGVQR